MLTAWPKITYRLLRTDSIEVGTGPVSKVLRPDPRTSTKNLTSAPRRRSAPRPELSAAIPVTRRALQRRRRGEPEAAGHDDPHSAGRGSEPTRAALGGAQPGRHHLRRQPRPSG